MQNGFLQEGRDFGDEDRPHGKVPLQGRVDTGVVTLGPELEDKRAAGYENLNKVKTQVSASIKLISGQAVRVFPKGSGEAFSPVTAKPRVRSAAFKVPALRPDTDSAPLRVW